MRRMKDSTFDWIGKIPIDWKLYRGRYIFHQRSEKGNKINLQLLSPTQQYGVIPQDEYDRITGNRAVKLKEDTNLSQLKTIHNGDFCISLRSFQGGFEYSENEGVVSPAYQVFYPIMNVDRRYYKYLFKDTSFIEKMNSYTLSLRDGKNISFFDFGNTYIPYPSVEDQKQIADFLDKKCAEIDPLAAEIEKQISTLEAYKKSVITEAVTKGLNPNVPMKESGIEFIGKIPEHWTIKKIKYLGTVRNGLTYSPIDLCDKNEGTLVLRSSNIQNGRIILDDNVYVSKSISSDLMVERGDILICSRNGSKDLIGKNALIGDINASFGAFMMIYRTQFPKYMCYVLNSGIFSYYLGTFFTSTINQLTSSNFRNMVAPFCLIESERNLITDFLDKKCAEIDAIILGKQQQLEVLTKYKKSLIYEYITGKKEVPHE